MGEFRIGWRVHALAILVLACANDVRAQDLATAAFSVDEHKVELEAREAARLALFDDPSERHRLLGLARRQRALAIASGVLFPIAGGLLLGAMSQFSLDLCLDFEGTGDCSSSGSSTNSAMAGLGIAGAVVAGGSWATSIAAGATSLRLSHALEGHGLYPGIAQARAAMVLAAGPVSSAFGLVSPWISLAHANRAIRMLDGSTVTAASRPVFVQAGVEAGPGYGMVQMRGAF